MKPVIPISVPRSRSRAFHEYLLRQTPERANEILAGEAVFNELAAAPTGCRATAERDFSELMAPGPSGRWLICWLTEGR
jgi:hypothetical protein